jgi:hypothetical protein
MKTFKKISNCLSIFVLVLVVVACEQSEPEPPLADQIMGDYTVTSYSFSGSTVTLPATNASGVTATAKIISTKVSDQSASFTFVFTQTKNGISSSSNSRLQDVALVKSKSGNIESADGRKRVEYANSKISVIFPGDETVADLTVSATKNNL